MNIYEATETSYKNGYRAGVKEFAERLKELPSVKNCEYEWFYLDIDNLLKEMAGEDNA